MLAITATLDQACHPKQGQMVAYRGLALPEFFAQSADMMFLCLQQQIQDSQSGVVGQQLEQTA